MSRVRRREPRTRALVALTVLTLVIVGLHWAERFDLGGPPGWTDAALDAWLADPVLVIATVARWLALGLAYYLAILMAAIAVTSDPERVARILPPGLWGLLVAVSRRSSFQGGFLFVHSIPLLVLYCIICSFCCA